MPFNLQPSLENQCIRLRPLRPEDFEPLYAVASDRLIWEQHPNPDRYQREVFANYFKGAMESGGAFLVTDARSAAIMGSSRYYDLDEASGSVAIGYTFIARQYWGGPSNRQLKTLMLDHAFKYVDRVIFKVGINNWRSRKAMEKLGGIYIGEESVSYSGEPSHPNVIFKIDAQDWANRAR